MVLDLDTLVTSDSLVASDALDDSAVVVQDVLAFLDDFHRSSGDDSAATDRQSDGSGPDALGVESNDRRTAGIDTFKLARRRARAETSNRARVQRYHRKKDELHALRRQVSSLVGRVELLQRCARSPVQVQQTSALGITIRRALGSRTRDLSWQRRADVEREMRVRSEQTNAQLRQLLLASMERASAIRVEAQQAGDDIRTSLDQLVGEECSASSRSSGKLEADAQDIAWSNVLRQLYEEACALADLNSLHTIENLDWAEPTFMGPPIEWTSSFSIPHSDPRAVGKRWWHSIQQHCFSPDSGVGLLTYRDGEVPRLEKRTKWSVFDNENQETRVTGVSLFESHDKDGHWVVVAYCSVYDDAGNDLLFHATSSQIVIKHQAPRPRSCIVRTHYRISVAGSGSDCNLGGTKPLKALAINAWVNKMRTKDDNMKRTFTRGYPIQ